MCSSRKERLYNEQMLRFTDYITLRITLHVPARVWLKKTLREPRSTKQREK